MTNHDDDIKDSDIHKDDINVDKDKEKKLRQQRYDQHDNTTILPPPVILTFQININSDLFLNFAITKKIILMD